MLRITAVIFFVLLMHSELDAQNKFQPSTYIGIQGSGSVNGVSFTPAIDQNPFPDVSYGLVIRHESEPHLATQLEINYAGRGWIEDREYCPL